MLKNKFSQTKSLILNFHKISKTMNHHHKKATVTKCSWSKPVIKQLRLP